MYFATLGPLRVADAGTEIELGGPRQQRVLAVLLAADGQYLTTDRIIHEVWGDDPPITAAHVVSTYVSSLRRALDGRVESDGAHYRIDTCADEVDAHLLRTRVAEARQLRTRDTAQAVLVLRDADRLWRGRPFGVLAEGSDLLEAAAAELEEIHLQGTELRIGIELERGNHAHVVPELEALTKYHPYRESLARSLMLALYRCDRQADAIRIGFDLRRLLVEDLGMEPSSATRNLEDRILRQDPDLDLDPPSSLPAPPSSFVGRDLEVASVVKMLDAHRMVTLKGMGGIGKTRLAIESATRMRQSFTDGVWFVDLGPVDPGQPAIPRIREALGLVDQAGMDQGALIRRFVARRHMLLVLDNCEHVAEDVGELVEMLLPSAPKLSVLVTSRRSLGIPGEVRYDVPTMSLPIPTQRPESFGTSDAERLFLERASRVDPTFTPVEGDAITVAQLCSALEGVPLSVELAASRCTTLSPAEILDRLDDRLRVLEPPSSARSRRHSLEATIDWSHQLLAARDKRVFDRLSVFCGPFDIAAAEAVVSSDAIPREDVEAALTALVDASMITRRRQADGSAAFGLLEVMRAFGRARLRRSEWDTLRRNHAVYFLGLAEASASLAFSPRHASAVGRLAAVDDDLVAALVWALESSPDLITAGVAAGLAHYWYRRGKPADAYRFGHVMAENDALDPMATAASDVSVAFGSQLLGHFDEAVAAMESAMRKIEGSDDWRMQVFAFNGQGQGAVLAGIRGLAAAMGGRILEVCERHNQVLPRAYGLALLGEEAFFHGGDIAEAERWLSEAIPLFATIGDEVAQNMFGLGVLAAVEAVQGKFESAERHAAEAAALGGPGWSATALIVMAAFALIPQGDIDRAEDVLLTGLARVHERSMLAWTKPALLMLGRVAAAREDWERASRLLGAAKPGLTAWACHPMFWTDEQRIRSEIGEGRYTSITTAAASEDLDTLVGELLAVQNG